MTSNLMEQRLSIVMDMLIAAADAGERCPSNMEIMNMVCAESTSMGIRILDILSDRGLIEVQRFGSGRIVKIIESGKMTAGKVGKPHWSINGVRPIRPLPDADTIFREDLPETRYVTRDPCPRCGVRADVGCGHSKAKLGTGMSL